MLTPRPYQEEALASLDNHLKTKSSNPCVVLPTGSGKSLVMATAVKRWKEKYKPLRACILAHRQELVKQNSDELKEIWEEADIGIHSAGLRRKDMHNDIIYAGIGSIYKKACEFDPFDVVIVDEAHRIPHSGEGQYRSFISGCRRYNPNVKVIGMTATPFRMSGALCHRDFILNEICYQANVKELIDQGYLCKLRTKMGDKLDLSGVTRSSKGDYITSSLSKRLNKEEIVKKAVDNALSSLVNESKKSFMFFCIDIEHAENVSACLKRWGVKAPCITQKTPASDRRRYSEAFKRGQLQALCNVNVYTEGFNAKQVDGIVLLRPTLSKALYWQMVGRGLRVHPSKDNCLILDYANCIEEHGPIDCMDEGKITMVKCQNCKDHFAKPIKQCPNCGWVIPKVKLEEIEKQEEIERRMHEEKASSRAILSGEPEKYTVDSVYVERHVVPGDNDCLRVTYRSGIKTFSELVKLDSLIETTQRSAKHWWKERFGTKSAEQITVVSALQDIFVGETIENITKQIIVKRYGNTYKIDKYVLKDF